VLGWSSRRRPVEYQTTRFSLNRLIWLALSLRRGIIRQETPLGHPGPETDRPPPGWKGRDDVIDERGRRDHVIDSPLCHVS
jgi:hypothetical protein